MTRTTTAHLFSSVNGVVEAPDRFQFDAFGPEEGQMMSETLAPVTDVVLGRVLWQEWSAYWPTADDPFGQFINPVRKHVASTTLGDDLPWNSTRITGDVVGHVRQLKEQEGGDKGDIAVVGGIETVRSLFTAGVIDRLNLTVHPAATNDGRRLFDGSVPLTRLRLLEGRTTPAGNALLTYALRG